jgi:hypothetical protein
MMSGLRWRRLVVVQELYCCAVEAGVTAELGFDQSGDWDGVLRERLFHRGMEWVPEDVAGETDAATEGDGFGVDEPGEVGEMDAESGAAVKMSRATWSPA